MSKTTTETKTETQVKTAASSVHKSEPHVIVHASPVHYETICKRAYDLYVNRGCAHGFHVEDWLEAEKQIVEESTN